MSRRISTATIPDDPKWIEFPRSDGDSSILPQNTQRIVDHEGHVNFMRPVPIDEGQSINWRCLVGAQVAKKLNLPEGPKYVLKTWPEGYHMYDHNKGPAGSPRHDPYLCGSVNVNRFRSTNEFIPHAVWLIQDPTLNRANCECKYCTKQPQRIISSTLGLSKRSPMPSPSPGNHASSSRARARETRIRDVKPYAAVRRAPKPPKLQAGPTQNLVPERNNDIRAAYTNGLSKASRLFRRGELVWCSLNVPIRGRNDPDDSIIFWPGLVEECNLKSEAIKNTPPPVTKEDADVKMNSDENAESQVIPKSKAESPVPWTIRQWTVYKVKLLAVAHSYFISDEQALPYLAYAPAETLLHAMSEQLTQIVQQASLTDLLSTINDRTFEFNPVASDRDMDVDPAVRYREATTPYTLAIQIAASVAKFWVPTDEWECKFTIPPIQDFTPKSAPSQSLHSLITASLSHNSQLPTNSQAPPAGPPPGVHGPPGIPPEELQSISTRMLGHTPRPTASIQTVTQLRYQGLWWGSEHIWTDELVRLKLARIQFAPQGSDTILPPAGPSKSTMEFLERAGTVTDADPQMLGAGEKGLFMRLEGLFVVDVPKADGHGMTRECRASGMLYELADEEWEEPEAIKPMREVNGIDKGKERAVNPELPIDPLTLEVVQRASSAIPASAPMQPPPLPDADSADSINYTVETAPPQTQTITPPKDHTLNAQLSRPVLSTPYPLPAAPRGYKFRPILKPGHEVIMSLALISGRYYPRLFEHPLMQDTLDKALHLAPEEGGLAKNKQMWALEGLLPGVYQAMEPTLWKPSRASTLREADTEARNEFRSFLESHLGDADAEGDDDLMLE